jgi:acetylornithine/succinyldiaminopimelate/putrescine aminotransferase
MIENSAEQGAYMQAGLESIHANVVKEVRGRGLMIAVELYPDAGTACHYCEVLARRGILTTTACTSSASPYRSLSSAMRWTGRSTGSPG